MQKDEINKISTAFWLNTWAQLATKKLKSKDLAETIGVPSQSLATAKYKSCDIRIALAYCIAQALGTTVGTLVSDPLKYKDSIENPISNEEKEYKNLIVKKFKNSVINTLPKLSLLQIEAVMTHVFSYLDKDFKAALREDKENDRI